MNLRDAYVAFEIFIWKLRIIVECMTQFAKIDLNSDWDLTF